MMNAETFETVMRNAKNLPKCDFPKGEFIRNMCRQMTDEQLIAFCNVCLRKGVMEYENGYIVTCVEGAVVKKAN